MFKYNPTDYISLFNKDENSEKLSKLGDTLERLHKVIDFETFRFDLENGMLNHDKKSPVSYKVMCLFSGLAYCRKQ